MKTQDGNQEYQRALGRDFHGRGETDLQHFRFAFDLNQEKVSSGERGK